MTTSSQRKNENTQKANTYCVAALLALSFALLVLSVGEFLFSPVSVIGIVSTCMGVASTLLCMLFFALYHHYLQQAEKDQ
jgi:predicted membrane channel-forming protein YqfA (hemolysin III family)